MPSSEPPAQPSQPLSESKKYQENFLKLLTAAKAGSLTLVLCTDPKESTRKIPVLAILVDNLDPEEFDGHTHLYLPIGTLLHTGVMNQFHRLEPPAALKSAWGWTWMLNEAKSSRPRVFPPFRLIDRTYR